MPQPRPRRPSNAPEHTGRDDSPAGLARMRAGLERRLDHQHWLVTCVNEARRRLCEGCAPHAAVDLSPADAAAVSLERIAAGERPPPGFPPHWYPPDHPLRHTGTPPPALHSRP
ncbi:MAG TPA: hypothetical protein VGE54_04135 [Brevundimonas sp.]